MFALQRERRDAREGGAVLPARRAIRGAALGPLPAPGEGRHGRRVAEGAAHDAAHAQQCDDAGDEDDADDDVVVDDQPPGKAKPGTSKTITLKSGHTLTMATTAGLFDSGEDDRKFLGDLIDKLNTYARANEPTE